MTADIDPVLEFLKENNLPINRETYFSVAFWGKRGGTPRRNQVRLR